MITGMGLALTSACVIPTPDAPSPDAGQYHPPRFVNKSTNPSFENGTSVNQSANRSTPDVDTVFDVGLEDVDNQTLYARLFVNRPGEHPTYTGVAFVSHKNYILFTPELSTVLSKGKGLLGITIRGLCDTYIMALGVWNLEIYVSDEPFIKDDTNVSDLRVTPGFRINDTWIINCIPAAPTVDGGI
jgi:hypothetical protein